MEFDYFPLISWYRRCGRDLPWRADGTSPWAVLVSEVMSQQTPVTRVIPAWRDSMQAGERSAQAVQARLLAALEPQQ